MLELARDLAGGPSVDHLPALGIQAEVFRHPIIGKLDARAYQRRLVLLWNGCSWLFGCRCGGGSRLCGGGACLAGCRCGGGAAVAGVDRIDDSLPLLFVAGDVLCRLERPYRPLNGPLTKAALRGQACGAAHPRPCLRLIVRHGGEHHQHRLLRPGDAGHGNCRSDKIEADKTHAASRQVRTVEGAPRSFRNAKASSVDVTTRTAKPRSASWRWIRSCSGETRFAQPGRFTSI